MFDWLFGNSKAASAAVDGLDALFLTDEEELQYDAAARNTVLEFKVRYAEATQGQSISRRVLVIAVASLWTLLILLMIIAGFIDRTEGSFALYVGKILIDVVNGPFMIILGFYFLAHVVKNKK